MPRFPAGWWPRRRRERRDPFSHVARGDLDVLMPPPYDVSDARQQAARARIETLVSKLQPGGLDAGSREVLNNMINAVADQEVARLHAERDERQSVGEILIGLAQKQLARRRPRYDADFARMRHAHEALAVTFQALTGKELRDLRAPFPRQADNDPVGSSFGPVDITDSWTRSADATPGPESGAPGTEASEVPDIPIFGPYPDPDDVPRISENGKRPPQGADTSSDPYGGG